eukprot:Rmarinus@m.24156
MAEVHIIGQIVGATGFDHLKGLLCKWEIEAGHGWRLLEGIESGQTQVDFPVDGEEVVWSHPVDLHYATKSVQGWPRLRIEVFHQDEYGRNDLAGYGVVHIPGCAGHFRFDCVTWRPEGDFWTEVKAFFIGGTPQLKDSSLVDDPTDRYRMRTVSTGEVQLSLSVLLRGTEKYGIHTRPDAERRRAPAAHTVAEVTS